MNTEKRALTDIDKHNGNALVDPQFFIPRTNNTDLPVHSFWPTGYDTASFFTGSGIERMLDSLINDYLLPMRSRDFILPSLFLDDLSDDWHKANEHIVNASLKHRLSIPRLMTLCIGDKIFSSEAKTHQLIEYVEEYAVDGFYLIPVRPNNAYLVEDTNWLLNVLDFVAGLKLQHKRVILGYANHQFLVMALAKVDVICAGTWVKTRMFPLGDYRDEEEQEGGHRTVWYYSPQALTEYQVDMLDIAKRTDCLEVLKTSQPFDTSYSSILFQGSQPSTVDFPEQKAFRHYLDCLRLQCMSTEKQSYEDTSRILRLMFETSLAITTEVRKKGVRGKYRDFNNVAETCLSVLDAFDNLRGLVYRNRWATI